MRTRRLRVTMREVEPGVVRVLDVPARALLPELHDLLQAGLGWTDSHLHRFETEHARYGMPDVDAPEDERDESKVRLGDLPAGFVYRYDFGDDWEHDVEVLSPGGPHPGCVSGQGPCPPEDCGGPPGYAALLAVLGDPGDEEHEAMRTWVGTRLREFDRAATDLRVRETAGAVPEPVQLLVEAARDGVKLTPGGRLPRSVARHVQQHYPNWYPLGRPARVEEDLPPLAALHDLLRRVGLLRLRHGVLRPTRAAEDATETIRRLRSWFTPRSGFVAVLAEVTAAVLARSGPQTAEELAARVYPLLGPRWVTHGGEGLTEQHTRSMISSLSAELRALDLVDTDVFTWGPGGSARSLLPGATVLVHVLPETV